MYLTSVGIYFMASSMTYVLDFWYADSYGHVIDQRLVEGVPVYRIKHLQDRLTQLGFMETVLIDETGIDLEFIREQ